MSDNLLAVKNYSCRRVYTVEFNIKSLLIGKGGSSKGFFIKAGATIVIIAAILTILVIPSMRNIYVKLAAVVITEQPFIIYSLLFSHS